MTVAEYQQAQNDIAEIKAQIAQLRDVVAKGVPAVREIYGADLPTPEPLPEAGASYPNVGALQFQQGKMMAGVEAAKKAVMPTTEALGAIRGNPEDQGETRRDIAKKLVEILTMGAGEAPDSTANAIANLGSGTAALIATAPAMLPLTVEQSVADGVERGNPLAPATDMAQAIGQTFQRQVTGEAGGVTRGEAWSKTPVEEAFNLATPLLAGLGIAKARTPKIKSIKEARAAINDIGKPKVDVPEVVQEPIRSEMPKVEQPTSAAEVVGKAKDAPITVDEMNINKQPITNEQVVTNNQPKAGLELNKSEWATKRVMVEKSLSRRHVAGDKKLDALDLADELADKGADISDDGYVTLYHRTTKSGADAIVKSGKMVGREDRQFFGTSPTGQIEGYGDAVIVVKLPVEKLELNDVFSNEAHVTLRGQSVKINAAKWGEPTTATEVVAKAKPNLVTGNVKQLTPDELTAAQAINLDNLLGGKISQQAPIATKKRGTSTYDGIGVGDIVVQNREGYTVKVDKLYENGKGEFTVIDAPDGHPWKNELNQGRTVRSSFHQPVTKNFTKLTPSDAPATATEVVAKTNTSTLRDALGKMLVKDAIATKDAEIGTNILLDMSERGFSPQKVHEEFINNVYDRLPEDIRAKFNRLIEKQTGEKVGQYWKDHKTMAKELIDLGDDAEMLEGTERGFAVMEAEAVKRFSGEGVPLIGENLKQPTAEEHGIRRPIRNKQILDAVNEKIKNGGDVILSTHTKHTRITKPEHLRVNSAGELQIVRGKNWDTVTEQYAENLAEQAGLERAKSLLDNLPEIDYASIPLQESHYLFLERGGKKYPVAGPYPDAAALEADRPRIESLLEKADPTSHFDTRVYGKTGSVEAQLAYAKRIDQLKTMEGYEPTATVQDAAVRPAQSINTAEAVVKKAGENELSRGTLFRDMPEDKLKAINADRTMQESHKWAHKVGEQVEYVHDKHGVVKAIVASSYIENGKPIYHVYPPGKKTSYGYHVTVRENELFKRGESVKSTKSANQPPTELHAGVNPFKIIDDYMTRRKLVNPLGTPEHVLSGKGIVEPFRKAQESIRNETKARGESLQETLKGIQRGSHEDNALYHRLDDPTAVLNEQEQAVRNYLDDLLTEVNKHREARGQEPVKRRKGYITHLVEEVEKQSREYGDTPMPKRFKFQFELAREGNASHKVSAIEALEVYTKAALKDIYIGDALAETVPKIEAMGDRPLIFKKSVTSEDGKVTNQSFYQFSDAPIITERGYAEAFIKGQMNVPTVGQRALETAFDIKPNTSQHAAMAITARFYQSLLGLAFDSGVKNLTQGINTMAEMGVVPTLKGYAKLATAKGLKGARAEHLLEDFNPLLMEGADLPFKTKTARAIGKGFSATLNAPMKVAEFINRGAAFHAAYDVFIKKGMSLEQAHEAARAAVRKTQFSYSKIDTSPALRGPFARTFSQFFSYPLKQSEMMYKWATKPGEQGKLIRYFLYTGMAVVGAKYAGVDMSGVFFDPIKMVDPNSKEGFQLPGSDKRVTIDPKKLGKSGYTPQGFAPSISIPYDFIKSQMSDDESTRAYGRTKALTSITPGGRYGKKVYDVITESDEKGKRDRLTRENTDKDKTLKLLGFRGTEREAESSRREKTAEVEKKYYATRQKLIDLKISGNEDEFVRVRDEFRDKYPFLYGRLMKGFGDAVKEERKKKGMTTDERFFDNSLRKQIDANL